MTPDIAGMVLLVVLSVVSCVTLGLAWYQFFRD